MAIANAVFSQPILEGITLELDGREAELLTRFLARITINIVDDLMPYTTGSYQQEVNETLFQIYKVLNNILQLEY